MITAPAGALLFYGRRVCAFRVPPHLNDTLMDSGVQTPNQAHRDNADEIPYQVGNAGGCALLGGLGEVDAYNEHDKDPDHDKQKACAI